ncbi:MAG: hypothetical protein JNM51_10620, partial [Bacteroidia bacterium]|nr:hypothetical protein [Bacteroidia bacterium]
MKIKLPFLLICVYFLAFLSGISQTTSVYYDNFSAPGADWSQFTGVSPGTSGTPKNTNWTMTSTSGGFGHGV